MANASFAMTTIAALLLAGLVPSGQADAGDLLLVPPGATLTATTVTTDLLVVAGTLILEGQATVQATTIHVARDGLILGAPGARGTDASGHAATATPGEDAADVRIEAVRLVVDEGGAILGGVGGRGGWAVARQTATAGHGGQGGDVTLLVQDAILNGAILPGSGGTGGSATVVAGHADDAQALAGHGGHSGQATLNGEPILLGSVPSALAANPCGVLRPDMFEVECPDPRERLAHLLDQLPKDIPSCQDAEEWLAMDGACDDPVALVRDLGPLAKREADALRDLALSCVTGTPAPPGLIDFDCAPIGQQVQHYAAWAQSEAQGAVQCVSKGITPFTGILTPFGTAQADPSCEEAVRIVGQTAQEVLDMASTCYPKGLSLAPTPPWATCAELLSILLSDAGNVVPVAPGLPGLVSMHCFTPKGKDGRDNPTGNGGDGGDACVSMKGNDGPNGKNGRNGVFTCTDGGMGGAGGEAGSADAVGGNGGLGARDGGNGGFANASSKGGDGGNGGRGGVRYGPGGECAGGHGGPGGIAGNAHAQGGNGGQGICGQGGEAGGADAKSEGGHGGSGGDGTPPGITGTPGAAALATPLGGSGGQGPGVCPL
jgi:hypothetical protein